jgi:hypothetical protein
MSTPQTMICPHCGAEFSYAQVAGPAERPPCLACLLDGKGPVPYGETRERRAG